MNKIIKNFKNINYGPAPEDDSEVLKWINKLPKPNHNFINGGWLKSSSRQKESFELNHSYNFNDDSSIFILHLNCFF